MDVTLHRDKTRGTRVTEGCDGIGCNFVQRKSPRSGKPAIDIFPAQSAQQTMRHRLQSVTSRRAPISPTACVEMGHPMVTGWANSFRHPNASPAFRGLQRVVNRRFRRYLTQRSTGRGSDGNAFRTASCMRWGSSPLAAACLSPWRNLRMVGDEDCRTAVLGKTARTVGWEGDGEPTMTGLVRHCHGETRSNS